MRAFVLLGICLMLAVTSMSCSTIRGIGEDIGTIGGWVAKGSDHVREGN